MGKFALLALAASLTCVCSAAPCVSGTLSNYVALGAGGCTIGTSSLFDFQVLGGTTGGTELLASNVSLSPLGGAFDPGLMTTLNTTARAGSVLETLFTFKISGSAYTGASITLANSSETGNGDVTGLTNLCIGGTFAANGLTGCSGLSAGLATVDGAQNQDLRNFSAAGLLSVTNDLTIDSGITGTATGGTFANRFTAVPEPATALFTIIGLTLAAAARKKLTNPRF